MEVRSISPDELEELLRLYTHLHADDPAPQPAAAAAAWRELMANPRYLYLGGYRDGTLVASCTLTVVPNLTRGCQPYGVVENVVTHAQHRRLGFGHAVLRTAISAAWDAGCYKVMLLTGRKDEATFRFYETAGFDRHEKQAFVAMRPA